MKNFRQTNLYVTLSAVLLALLCVADAPAGAPCNPPITADCQGPFNVNVGDDTGLLVFGFPDSNYGSFGVNHVDTFAPTGCGSAGTIFRNYSISSSTCDGTAQCTQVIFVHELSALPATIPIPPHAIRFCEEDTSPASTGAPVIPDLCGEIVLLHTDNFVPTCGGGGTIFRVWTALDNANNSVSSTSQIITVLNRIPTIAAPPDLTLSCGDNTMPASTGTAVSDACGILTISSSDVVTASCAATSTIVRTWTVVDDCGNTSSQDQVITVENGAPVITCPADVSVGCADDSSPASTGTATATDDCGGVTITSSDSFAAVCGNAGVLTRTWVATDECGVTSTCDQTITIGDDAPSIVCPGNLVVECGNETTPLATGVATSDQSCGPVTITFTDSTSNACGNTGVITRTWVATNECGAFSNCDQTITVVDTSAPDLSCPEDITLECFESTDTSNTGGIATATDACDPAVVITFADTTVGACPGPMTITRRWTATDECGNSDVCDQFITVRTFAHSGWNHVSAEINLTKNEPAYWSAATGQPKGVPPFTVLDPAGLPSNIAGRPDPEGSGEWILRGYVVGWAVNADNEEIRWNHLKGDAVIINYEQASAWEYNAWAFPVVNGTAHGAQSGTPGVMNLDGTEYAPSFAMLVLDFYAPGNTPFPGTMIDTDLILLPAGVDLRQEDDGPITTKAKIDIWNENEVKFNGTERCITCWDQTLLRNYTELGVPNSFLYGNLQTDKGKARIDGIRSDNCDVDYEFDPDIPFGADPRDIVSQDASLLGVSSKHISFGSDKIVAAAGTNLIGMGDEGAVIKYDPLGGTPESAGSANEIRRSLLRRGGEREPIGATEGVASNVDRVSGSEKGSLLIWSNVEIRWDKNGNLIQDTFLDVSNDFGEDVRFQMYFINGDTPLVASP